MVESGCDSAGRAEGSDWFVCEPLRNTTEGEHDAVGDITAITVKGRVDAQASSREARRHKEKASQQGVGSSPQGSGVGGAAGGSRGARQDRGGASRRTAGRSPHGSQRQCAGGGAERPGRA